MSNRRKPRSVAPRVQWRRDADSARRLFTVMVDADAATIDAEVMRLAQSDALGPAVGLVFAAQQQALVAATGTPAVARAMVDQALSRLAEGEL